MDALKLKDSTPKRKAKQIYLIKFYMVWTLQKWILKDWGEMDSYVDWIKEYDLMAINWGGTQQGLFVQILLATLCVTCLTSRFKTGYTSHEDLQRRVHSLRSDLSRSYGLLWEMSLVSVTHLGRKSRREEDGSCWDRPSFWGSPNLFQFDILYSVCQGVWL